MKNLLIIPAAGNASRLNINYPKKFRLIDLLLSRIKVEKIIFVIKKKDINIFKNHLKNKYKTLNYDLVVQNKAKGMADAVLSSSRKWSGYQKIIILWGDQIGISKNTLNKIIKHKVRLKNILLPLVYKKNLYVEYIFKKKKLVAINEYRENDNISNKGFSDVGLFAFSSYNLKKKSFK